MLALGRKREIPRSKKKVLEKAETGTDRAQIRQIQMRFPSEINLFGLNKNKSKKCRGEGMKDAAGS